MNGNGPLGSPRTQWYIVLGIFALLGALVGVFAVGYLGLHDAKAATTLGAVVTALLGALYTVVRSNGNGTPKGG